jgi:hypothetical protein
MTTPLQIIHTNTKWLQVAFLTVVVRNAALVANYPGGIRAYANKYSPMCNDDISVSCYMGDDADDVYFDLRKNGFKRGADLTVIDVGVYDVSGAVKMP